MLVTDIPDKKKLLTIPTIAVLSGCKRPFCNRKDVSISPACDMAASNLGREDR